MGQDPKFKGGFYHDDDVVSMPQWVALHVPQVTSDEDSVEESDSGPIQGLRLARKMGLVSYRSREEFDGRFQWELRPDGRFEVQDYLEHNANRFTGSYDANCYI